MVEDLGVFISSYIKMSNEKNEEKKRIQYECLKCDYNTCKKTDFERHCATRKHISVVNTEKNIEKNEEKKRKQYECLDCNYITSKKTDFDRHIASRKHILVTTLESIDEKKQKFYECIPCQFNTANKTDYERHCNTRKHRESVIEQPITDISDNLLDVTNIHSLFLELFKRQDFLQNTLVELAKNQAPNHNTNSNNTSNNFNLQFFLNETCKDAMNIDEFIKSLKVTMEDFETTGKIGFVEGITRIILNGLKQVDSTKRPIHCTDVKRETVYIKDEEV
jgi:hypothetical protein